MENKFRRIDVPSFGILQGWQSYRRLATKEIVEHHNLSQERGLGGTWLQRRP